MTRKRPSTSRQKKNRSARGRQDGGAADANGGASHDGAGTNHRVLAAIIAIAAFVAALVLLNNDAAPSEVAVAQAPQPKTAASPASDPSSQGHADRANVAPKIEAQTTAKVQEVERQAEAPDTADASATTSSTVPEPAPGTVVAVYPHDPTSFTQGLFVHDNKLYESTGLYGSSVLRTVDLQTGRRVDEVTLPKRLFGEGSAVWNDKIVMLTWKERVGRVYDVQSLKLLAEQPFATTTQEGWGITHDGRRLIVSDGSSFLHFWDPSALPRFEEIAPRMQVVDERGVPVQKLNELEYINGEIYANVWYQDDILRIDPDTGRVKGRLNFDGLIQPYARALRQTRVDCLNGIAWNASDPEHILITGKWWPKLFKVKI